MEPTALLIFVHVMAAIGIFAAFSIEGVAQAYLRRAATPNEVRAWAGTYRAVRPIGIVSLLTVIGTGLWLTLAEWGWPAWILVSIGGIVVLAVLGAIGGIRYSASLEAASQESGLLSTSARVALTSPLPLALLIMRMFIATGVVFLMTVKPDLLRSLIGLGAAAVIGFGTAALVVARADAGTPEMLAHRASAPRTVSRPAPRR
jgi:hypothetical protein